MLARVPLILALALMLAVPATADAGKRSKHLWATINICDTNRSPDTIGIRARMPGNGTRQRMWMKFKTQYYSTKHYRWRKVPEGGRSPWVEVGSALFLYKETGYSFTFDPPPAGSSFLLRGVVKFQWRTKSGKVKRRKRRITSGGHPSRGAQPRGFSARRCRIKNPAVPETVAPKHVAPRVVDSR